MSKAVCICDTYKNPVITCYVSIHRLPSTSYLKMVDIWFMFAMLIPFTEVIAHTVLHSMRFKGLNTEDDTKIYILEKAMKYGLPFIFITFSVIFFSVGYILKFSWTKFSWLPRNNSKIFHNFGTSKFSSINIGYLLNKLSMSFFYKKSIAISNF